jgi:hypothetical protein
MGRRERPRRAGENGGAANSAMSTNGNISLLGDRVSGPACGHVTFLPPPFETRPDQGTAQSRSVNDRKFTWRPSRSDRVSSLTPGPDGGGHDRLRCTSFLLLIAPIEELLE